MTLNIGTPAVEAVKELRNSAAFQTVLEGLEEQTRVAMNRALESTPEFRMDLVGYARGVRDVWIALKSAATGIAPNQVKKPGPAVEKS